MTCEEGTAATMFYAITLKYAFKQTTYVMQLLSVNDCTKVCS